MARDKKDESYNWLDDPFDEKKATEEQQRSSMGSGSKLAIGLGCLVVVIVCVILVVAALIALISFSV